MEDSYRFYVAAEWTDGRRGVTHAEADAPAIHFAAPPEFNGEAGVWTPEHFFLAALVSCYLVTFRAIAEMSRFESVALDVSAEGAIQKGPDGLAFTELCLRPTLTLAHEDARERATRLLEKAAKSCLISHSVRAEVVVQPRILVLEQMAVG